MAESVTQRLNGTQLDAQTKRQLEALFDAIIADQTAMAAKLNLDAGVTDTNYNAAPNLVT